MAVAAVVPDVLPAAAYVAAFTTVYPGVGNALNQGVDLMLGALPRSSPATNALQTAASTTGEGSDAPVAESAQVAAGRMFANVAGGFSRWTGEGLIYQAAGGMAEAGAHLAIGAAVNLTAASCAAACAGVSMVAAAVVSPVVFGVGLVVGGRALWRSISGGKA